MTRPRVAIIGAGFSGAAVAANLLRRGRNAPDVVLIERKPRFGPGLAYATKDDAHFLNVRATNLSMFADAPDHFTRWLAQRGLRDQAARYVRRRLYGRYIESVLSKARRSFFDGGLKRVRGDVLTCRPSGEGWTIALASGADIQADAVVLAMGHAPPSSLGVFAEAGVPVIDAWDVGGQRRMPAGDVLLIGAGLTAVDVALSLAKHRDKGVIYALSRRGLPPRPHLLKASPRYGGIVDLPLPLSHALHAFRREVRAMAARGEPWQHAIDHLRARTPELWRRLPLEAQQRFLRHLRPWWDVHRHRMAPEVATRIKELMDAGRLRVLGGEVALAELAGNKIKLQHRQRGSFVRHRLELAGVINCTSASLDPAHSQEPLMRQLMGDGIVRAPANRMGLDVDLGGRVLDGEGQAHANLFALGPLTIGAFWECIAVPEIRVRATTLAMMLAPEA